MQTVLTLSMALPMLAATIAIIVRERRQMRQIRFYHR